MENNRCGILEVAPVASIHVALSFTHRTSTAHMSSNRNLNISNRKYSCNGNTGLLM